MISESLHKVVARKSFVRFLDYKQGTVGVERCASLPVAMMAIISHITSTILGRFSRRAGTFEASFVVL